MKPESKTLLKHRSRKFLNPRFGMATVQNSVYVTDNKYIVDFGKHKGKVVEECFMSANLSLSDCNNTISLEFSAGDEKSRKERLKKVNLLIEELFVIKNALEDFKLKKTYSKTVAGQEYESSVEGEDDEF